MGPSNHNADVSRILAYIILGEKLHLYHVAGIALIASGIVIGCCSNRSCLIDPQHRSREICNGLIAYENPVPVIPAIG